ncbi:MAG TPA: S26 family signal peptidase [Mycobacteriales bacterium]|nr:S26 family signal peptidase [Mycobacteriales bacterium]
MRPRWGRVGVVGSSMVPALVAGEQLLVRWGGEPAVGDIVVVRRGGRLDVKRAVRREAAGWWVAGDNTGASEDSRVYGVVPDADVLGVARWRCWPWRSRGRV